MTKIILLFLNIFFMQFYAADSWDEPAAPLGRKGYVLNNSGHAVDRHSVMSAEQCAIRARLMQKCRITSYKDLDDLNTAVQDGLHHLVRENVMNSSYNVSGIYQTRQFRVNWGNRNSQWGEADCRHIMICCEYINQTDTRYNYNLITAYPVKLYLSPCVIS